MSPKIPGFRREQPDCVHGGRGTQVHVALRRGQILVPRQFLNRPCWRSLQREVRAERLEFIDEGVSGAKTRRPALARLMLAARRRQLDFVGAACASIRWWRRALAGTGDELAVAGRHFPSWPDHLVPMARLSRPATGRQRGTTVAPCGLHSSPRPPTSSEHRYQTFGNTVIHTYRQDGMNPQGVVVPTRQLQAWVKQDKHWIVATSHATYVAQR